MSSTFKEIRFKPGEVVFNEGELADKLYFVKSGLLEIIDGTGIIISRVGAGQSFGEQAFLKGGIRGAGVRAVDEVVCIEISSEEANSLLLGMSPFLIPIFEALLLQQNMSNELVKSKRNITQ